VKAEMQSSIILTKMVHPPQNRTGKGGNWNKKDCFLHGAVLFILHSRAQNCHVLDNIATWH
jgi:hypothetical protein